MKTLLNKKNYLKLIRGASLFTTGGGIPYKDQVTSLKPLKTINIPILSLDEFGSDAYNDALRVRDFARQLERELALAQKRVVELEEEVARLNVAIGFEGA